MNEFMKPICGMMIAFILVAMSLITMHDDVGISGNETNPRANYHGAGVLIATDMYYQLAFAENYTSQAPVLAGGFSSVSMGIILGVIGLIIFTVVMLVKNKMG